MFARTDRLLLRPAWAEDAPALLRAIGDETILRNLATQPWPFTAADAEAFVQRAGDPARPSFLLFRRTMGAPKLVGGAGLGIAPDGGVELGYWIARDHWGLGYATEAAGAVMRIARESLRLERVAASHFLDNPASGRVLAKLGFTSTGRIAPRYSAGRRGAALACDHVWEVAAPQYREGLAQAREAA